MTVQELVVGESTTGSGPRLRLSLRGIHKSFGETVALDGLDLDVVAGEILGIAGPNGAGKSTLVRVLAGEEPLDAGDISVNETPWQPGDPRDPVAVVHQEPQLWPNMTVAQNLLVGREGTRFAFPELPERDRLILDQLEIGDYADTALDQCALAVRQRAEIARALARDARFFLFDEPNSALTEDESNKLFAWMHELSQRGRIVMLVSHRLGELVAHADRVVVIRDGRVRAQLPKASLSEEAIARELVVGHASTESGRSAAQARQGAEPAIRLGGWTDVRGVFTGIDLEVGRGEVVAVVGVEGSGARQVVASAAGYEPATGIATVASGGAESIPADTAYLGADRRANLFGNLTVGHNLVIRLGVPDIASRSGVLRTARVRRLGRELVERFRIRASSADAPLSSLSGGNQQKVAIAAAISRQPLVLVLEEPTRGVDVGSKAEIYRLLHEFAAAGNGVLVYCTEVPEVFELAERVVVVDKGRVAATLEVGAFQDVAALAEAIAGVEHIEPGVIEPPAPPPVSGQARASKPSGKQAPQ